MSIKQSSKTFRLMRLLMLFSLTLSMVGFTGLGWLFWSSKQACFEETILSKTIPITVDGRFCEMITPEVDLNLSWPGRIPLGKPGSIAVHLKSNGDIQWTCSDLSNSFDVLLESRVEIPDSSLHPSDRLIQSFSQSAEMNFFWTVDFHTMSTSELSSFWLNLIVRKTAAELDSNESIIDIENWSLMTKSLPISIISLAGLPYQHLFQVALSLTWSGLFLFLIFLLYDQRGTVA